MGLNVRSSRLAKVEEHLQRVGATMTPVDIEAEREKLEQGVRAAREALSLAERDSSMPDGRAARRVEDARDAVTEVESELRAFTAEHDPDPGAIEREMMAYELNAAVCCMGLGDFDLAGFIASYCEALGSLPADRHEGVFDLARHVCKPMGGCSAADTRRRLEELIVAVKQRAR